MKKLIILLLFSNYLLAQTPPELNWSLNLKNGPTSGAFIVSKVIFDEVSSEFNSLPITIGNFTNTGNFNYGNDSAFDYFEDAIGDNINTFITKHNENDEVIWVKKIHGNGVYTATGAIVAGNFFYVVGELNGTVDFNPGSATANRTSNSEKNIVIAKYDLNGFYVNSKLIGGSGLVSAHKIVNNGNKLAIIGELEGTVDFDPNIGVYNLTSRGEKDGYVSVYNTNLAHQWTQQYGDIGTDTMKDIAIDGSYVYSTATTQSAGIDCFNNNLVDPNSFIGDYTLTFEGGGITASENAPVWGDGTVVTLSAGANETGRVFTVGCYPSLADLPDTDYGITLNCGLAILDGEINGTSTGIGCSGSLISLQSTTVNGAFDLTDDSVFTLIFAEDVGGVSCGAEGLTSYTLTKNGEPIISDEDFDDTIVALDGKHHSDLVVYNTTNGEVQSSTSIGSQIDTPLNEIYNNIHISSNGEIFVLGSYQGENTFLTYDAVQSDLLVPEVLPNQADDFNRIFLSKFEPFANKIEGLNNNLANASDFDIIGSSAPGGVNQMYFDSAEPNIALRYIYLIQGEIYFNGAGQIWGQLDADNQVLTSGGAGISIEEEGYYVVKLDYTNSQIILEKIPDFIMSEYVSIRDVVDYNNKTVLSHLNQDNNSLTITYSSYSGTPGGVYYDNDGIYYEIFPSESTDSDGNAIYTYDYVQSVISEVSLTDYQILWEKAGPPINLEYCELIPSTEFIFYLINGISGSVDLDTRADSVDIINSYFSKVSKYLLDGEYYSSLSYNPRINFQTNYHVHNHISADGSKYFVGHNRSGLDFNNDNNLDLDAKPVNSNSFYIRKYNLSNEFMWMKSIENPSDVNQTNVDVFWISEDSQNNLLLFGQYFGDLDFDFSTTNGLMSSPTTMTFMAKYSPEGDLIWVKNMRSDAAQINFNGRHKIVVDNNDNMYFLTTMFSNENADPIDIDPRDEAAYYINFPQGNTWYSSIMKFDSDLNVIYAKLMDSELSLTGIFNGRDNGIAINNEVLQLLYVGADPQGVNENGSILIDVDVSEENEILVESYGREILVNYNLDGEYIDHHELANNLNNPQNLFHSRSSRPIVDAENNIYTKSIYYYSRDEGGWDSPQLIRKFNSNYELQWEKTISNNGLNLASMYPAQLHSSGLIFYKFNYFDYLDLSDVGAGIIYSEAPFNAGSAIVAIDTNSGELVHLKNYSNNSRYTEFSVSDQELLVSGNYNNQLELGFNSSAIDYTAYNSVSEQFYASYLLSESLGIDSNTSEINWTVFPNPTSDVITIKINSLDFSELYNALGQRILVSKSPDISLSGLKVGLYFVKVFDKSGREFTKKIIKE